VPDLVLVLILVIVPENRIKAMNAFWHMMHHFQPAPSYMLSTVCILTLLK